MGTDESPNVTDDAADEIMDRIVKSATQVPSQRVVPRERKRSRANRKSRKCLGAGVRDLPCRDLPSCSLSPGKGSRSEAGSSQLSVMPGGSTPAHQREVSWLTISIATVEEEGAATPVQCICHFWAGLLQFSLCSQEGLRDPLISLVCRLGAGINCQALPQVLF